MARTRLSVCRALGALTVAALLCAPAATLRAQDADKVIARAKAFLARGKAATPPPPRSKGPTES